MSYGKIYESTYWGVGRDNSIGWGIVYKDLGATNLLDQYSGAVAAYSVRKLSSSYDGFCLKVRNKTTQTTTDIGFDADGLIDTTALATAANESGDTKQLAIVEWYDQSGNGNNATQTADADQPVIYKGTGLQEMNGKPVVVESNTNSHLSIQGITSLTNNAWIFAATKANDNDMFMADLGTTPYVGFATDGEAGVSMNPTSGTYYKNGSTTSLSATTRNDIFDTYNEQSLFTFNATNFVIGDYLELGWVSSFSMWDLQEVIIYDSDQATNRSGIETNINGYYSIY